MINYVYYWLFLNRRCDLVSFNCIYSLTPAAIQCGLELFLGFAQFENIDCVIFIMNYTLILLFIRIINARKHDF